MLTMIDGVTTATIEVIPGVVGTAVEESPASIMLQGGGMIDGSSVDSCSQPLCQRVVMWLKYNKRNV